MKVAIAVIHDQQDAVLITRRPLHKVQGGRWEFPGGKVEVSESPAEALHRELREEIGICIKESLYLGEVIYRYGEQEIHLTIFQVKHYTGNPQCLENQLDMQWIPLEKLHEIDFPEANQEVLKLISAPWRSAV